MHQRLGAVETFVPVRLLRSLPRPAKQYSRMLSKLKTIVDDCFLESLRCTNKRIVTAVYRFDRDVDLVCVIWLAMPEYVWRYKW